MDRWKNKELKCMELGGNKVAASYFEKNNMMKADGTPNHQAPALAKHKMDLTKRAEAAVLGSYIQHVIAAVNEKPTITTEVKPVIGVSAITFAT